MSLVKTVELRILADAGDAQEQLDELDAKARDLDASDIKMRFRLDDADGKGQLDDLREQADRLGLKNVDIKVNVNGAGKAIAQLSAVRAEQDAAGDTSKLDDLIPSISGINVTDADRSMAEIRGLEAQVDELKAKTRSDIKLHVDVEDVARSIAEIRMLDEQIDGLKRKEDEGGGGLLSGLSGLGGKIGGFMNAGPSLPEAIPGIGGMSIPKLAALAPVVGALAAEATGLASGFAAAGAGAGAFALLAIPAFDKVKSAMGDTTKELAKLDPDERGAVLGVRGITAEWQKMGKAFEPDAFKVFNDGLQIAGTLLPTVTPFADTFATSVGGLLHRLEQAVTPTRTFTELIPRVGIGFDSLKKITVPTGFGDFLKSLHSIEGPAIGAIGTGLGKVAESVGKLLTSMSSKDVAHTIAIAFDAISGAISGVTAVVQGSMHVWDSVSKGIATSFDGTIGDAKGFYRGVVSAFSATTGFLGSIPGKIEGFFSGAGGWLTSAGSSLIHGFEGGAKSDWGAVQGWFSGLGKSITGFLKDAGSWLLHAGQELMEGLIHGIESKRGGLIGELASIAGDIPKQVASLLGIKSPSIVMRGLGQETGAGLILGLADSRPGVSSASRGLAGAVTGGYAAASRGTGVTMGGGGGDVHFHINGLVVDPQGTARQIQQIMRDYKRTGGGVALGLA
jgi:hypothetical protein